MQQTRRPRILEGFELSGSGSLRRLVVIDVEMIIDL